ncbi:S8 family serine peptidase [Gracilibacillus dipsosauri]|uniref:Peptidase S8 n=1 Tax=Gracilibacillus dipsosauri TaxID=178340 RepID=A0A317KZB0_9BACI|nr:S8 family serine peptidase [Gracilibacillus dipsosauri]PWU66989.1 peptidase S8 [Gracilibacillus dipsosauri]
MIWWLLMTLIVQPEQQEQSFIIEVEDNPHEIAEEMETYYPRVEILHIYDTIFNGIAIKADNRTLKKLKNRGLFKQSYPVQKYQALETKETINQSVPFLLPENLPYTGDGVKVGVIDTGIDYTHPDLRKSYKGGYDLVDFDQDPMETTEEQGIPTLHGTHVAGIIAANGEMKGVAPEAELYGYRALGPGGTGTSVQVMAAIEQAVEDKMDIINLSLGNTINGPDWPTSIAVNRATEQGVTVVIANGNTGPDPWTVGSPATADSVIAVGASTPQIEHPYLYDRFLEKKIELWPMQGAPPWALERDLRIAHEDRAKDKLPMDSILIVDRGKQPFTKLAIEAEKRGAKALLIANNEEESFQGAIEAEISIPVAGISKETGEWLKNAHGSYLEIKHEKIQDTVTDFSSRGPVTVNWAIKPEVVAPGASIMSTVPNGYQSLNGTSMAAPHVAGILALLKEAHPDWTPQQLKAALLTTADPLESFLPTEQGAGKVDIGEAINTDTLLYHSFVQLGKSGAILERSSHSMIVENIGDQPISYSFQQPKLSQDLRFHLPSSFTLQPGEKKEIEIEAILQAKQQAEPFLQGYLYLNDHPIPYLYVTEAADVPMAMGLEFYLEPFDGQYHYQLYMVEDAESVTVDLYDDKTFAFKETILQLNDQSKGVVEGSLKKDRIPAKGSYVANITVITTNGEKYQYQTPILIEDTLRQE